MDNYTYIVRTQCHNNQWLYDYHTADCGVPLVNSGVKLNYNSTLDGSGLILTCENVISNVNTKIHGVTCHDNGSWIPDPAEFIESCSSFITASQGNLIKKRILFIIYNCTTRHCYIHVNSNH